MHAPYALAFKARRAVHFPGGSRMNLPNTITLSRIPLTFLIAWLMYQPWVGAPTLALVLFLAAASGDWLDGFIARRQGLVTTFGKLMDALVDKIMVLGLVIAFVGHPRHEISVPLALITLCREFLVTGMRMVAASRGVIVSADTGGKTKTVTQLISLGFLLGAPAIGRDLAYAAGRSFTGLSEGISQAGVVIFWIGTVVAVWSGARYILQFRAIFLDNGKGGDTPLGSA
jgi:CDP-diacylglycerol--glycerol-3-phosphate 3-phosphatidyltransferase